MKSAAKSDGLSRSHSQSVHTGDNFIGVNDLTEAVLSEAEGFRSIKLTGGDNTRLKGAYRYLGGAHD
jgi:hypothetical protein